MNAQPFRPRVYLKEGCPMSFKLMVFLAEAGLEREVELIRCDPESAEYESIRHKLSEGLGKPVTFPTAELAPGQFASESDELIRHFAADHGVDVASLPALSFYAETILPQVVALHQIWQREEEPIVDTRLGRGIQ